ncbi:MAG TPA: hypothetical protein VI341_00600 [Actinomycetota bacterium]
MGQQQAARDQVGRTGGERDESDIVFVERDVVRGVDPRTIEEQARPIEADRPSGARDAVQESCREARTAPKIDGQRRWFVSRFGHEGGRRRLEHRRDTFESARSEFGVAVGVASGHAAP